MRCFQIMEAPHPESLYAWVGRWDDLIDFEIVPVLTSTDFRARTQLEALAHCLSAAVGPYRVGAGARGHLFAGSGPARLPPIRLPAESFRIPRRACRTRSTHPAARQGADRSWPS
jgi:hypothetical protein